MKTELRISGMTCNHCVHHVQSALRSHGGVSSAIVDLAKGSAIVEHADTVTAAELCAAVADAGYEGAPLGGAAEPS